MMCHFRNLKLRARNSKLKTAFSLVEVVTALGILALVCSSVCVVINRCTASAADSALRRQAFEVARENMETLLAGDSVAEMAEFGSSDKYPDIQWQTTLEAFYESTTERMWLQAVCSAEYTDTAGQVQTVELTHWLTDLTKEQLRQIIEEMEEGENGLDEPIIETEEDAAEYVGVDVETIQQWVEDGMLMTEDGDYIENELALYKRTGGNPTIDDRKRQEEADKSLEEAMSETGEQEQDDVKKIGGHTLEELVQMGFPQQLLEGLFSDM